MIILRREEKDDKCYESNIPYTKNEIKKMNTKGRRKKKRSRTIPKIEMMAFRMLPNRSGTGVTLYTASNLSLILESKNLCE